MRFSRSRANWLMFFLFGVQSVVQAAEVSQATFPEIVHWKNQPVIEFEQNKKAKLEKNQPLKNAFLVKTLAADEIELKFSSGETLVVLGNSQVSVPQISPDTGEISEILLLEGRVRLVSPLSVKKVRIRSDFFDLVVPAGLDAFFTLDKKQPLARIEVVHGEIEAVFFDFEKRQLLKQGESITFNGEHEGESPGKSIKYDYLLNSRKAPHGILQPVAKFDASLYSAEEIMQKKIKLQNIENQKKIQAQALQKKLAYEATFLCHQPFGQKDQCYWQKKNNLCFRYRCNVAGQWGDETERPVTDACASGVEKPKASACDY